MAASAKITERGADGIAVEALIPASQPGDVFPAGVVLDYVGSAAPTGWLIFDGSTIARASYPALTAIFLAGGSALGAGDGSTTLVLPDGRQKVVVGKHSSGTFGTMGATGGVETVTLDSTQIPAHAHVINAESPGTGTETVAHNHSFSYTTLANTRGLQTGVVVVSIDASGVGNNGFTTGTENQAHAHVVNSHSHGGATQNAGGGLSHSNLQPFIVLNKIIRAY